MKSTSLSFTSLIYMVAVDDCRKTKSYILSLIIGEEKCNECNGVIVYMCLLSSFVYVGNDSSLSIMLFTSNNPSPLTLAY